MFHFKIVMVEVLNIEPSVYKIIHELRTNKKTKKYYSDNPVIVVFGTELNEYTERLKGYSLNAGIIVKSVDAFNGNIESVLTELHARNPSLAGVLFHNADNLIGEVFTYLKYIYDIDSAYHIEIENYHESLNCRDEAVERVRKMFEDQPLVIVKDNEISELPEKYILVDARFTIEELKDYKPLPGELCRKATFVVNLKELTLGILFERAYKGYFREVIPKLEEKGLREQLYGLIERTLKKSEELLSERKPKERWEAFRKRWQKQKANK